MGNQVLARALECHRVGIVAIPAREDGTKRPGTSNGEWTRYQQEPPTGTQLRCWFTSKHRAVGNVTGVVSGGMELLEFEGLAVAEGVFETFLVAAETAGLSDRVAEIRAGWEETSPSLGIHLHYRCSVVEGNQKLARRPATAEELRTDPKQKVKILAETRGEGGFVVTAPTGGSAHNTGESWRLISGGPSSIVTIQPEERERLLALVRTLDQMPFREEYEPLGGPQEAAEGRPGEDFDAMADWTDLLDGWTEFYTTEAGKTYLTRPGKDMGVSATINHDGTNRLFVFSTSTELEAERYYTKFQAFTFLHHDGNFKAAASALRRLGYGEEADDEEGPSQKASQSTQLVRIALQRYRLGHSDDGTPFAVPLAGPNEARGLRGTRGLRGELAEAFFTSMERAPTSSALSDAIAVLEGMAIRSDPEHVAVRVARHGDGLVLDLCRPGGEVVIISPAGAEINPRSPVLFRRTQAMAALPLPALGEGRIEDLKDLLNIPEADWPLIVLWLVTALMPDLPHLILILRGEQGTAKSTAGRMCCAVVDPSPAPLRRPPSNMKDWAAAALASWICCIDNVSVIPPWLSDALCRAATGDGDVARQLYTDNEPVVISFRRVVALTSIATGPVAGDLAERSLPIDLEPIPEGARRLEREVAQQFERAHPSILAGLLELTAKVLQVLPTVTLINAPRMADVCQVAAAIDIVLAKDEGSTGTTGTAVREHVSTELAYRAKLGEALSDALDQDSLGQALLKMVKPGKSVTLTPQAMLNALTRIVTDDGDTFPPKGWPQAPQGLTDALKRLSVSLRSQGITWESRKANGKRQLSVVRLEGVPVDPARSGRPTTAATRKTPLMTQRKSTRKFSHRNKVA